MSEDRQLDAKISQEEYIQVFEKQKEIKNKTISRLEKQLCEVSEKLSEQEIKYRNTCEAREELRFHVHKLEGEVKSLKHENEKLENVITNMKTSKTSKEKAHEALIASYEDQIRKFENKLKMKEERIAQVMSEDNDKMSVSEKPVHIDQFNEPLKQIVDLEVNLSELKEKIQSYETKIDQLESEKNEIKCAFVKQETNWKDTEAILKDNLKKCEENLQNEKIIKASLLEKLRVLNPEEMTNIPEKTHIEAGIVHIEYELEETIKSIPKEFQHLSEHLRKLEQDLSVFKEKLHHTKDFQLEKNEIPKENPLKRQSPEELPRKNIKKSRNTKKTLFQETKENISNDSIKKEKTSKESKKMHVEKASSSRAKNAAVSPDKTSAGENVDSVKGRGKRDLRPRKK